PPAPPTPPVPPVPPGPAPPAPVAVEETLVGTHPPQAPMKKAKIKAALWRMSTPDDRYTLPASSPSLTCPRSHPAGCSGQPTSSRRSGALGMCHPTVTRNSCRAEMNTDSRSTRVSPTNALAPRDARIKPSDISRAPAIRASRLSRAELLRNHEEASVH